MVEATKQRLTSVQEQQVATILLAMFGTPDEPHCLPESGLDEAKLRLAAGPVRSDISGRKNGLFREHCVHCHGVTGDGLGPTAAFLNPYPRDYRPGVFKFKSTEPWASMQVYCFAVFSTLRFFKNRRFNKFFPQVQA